MQAAGSNACPPSRAAPASRMALPSQPACQDSRCYRGWLTSCGELVGQRHAGQGRLVRRGPGHHPLNTSSQPLPACHSHPDTPGTRHMHTQLWLLFAPASHRASRHEVCTPEPLHPCVEKAQDTCMNPGTLRDLSTVESHSKVWKKCFTAVCNASREGCKLFKINHALHNVQLSLLLLYFCTQ